ncbi:LOW QUALITY PROTEIN: hypothetical protein TorRG33x02_271190 [Trema orientale]|uniref:Uncharacterized protein n=1 Tax=Trema orientale TaxID=63057 RepID=A0A2P5CWC9_TREOI|nr:LOW QUALITY PROTEIN: hypothetical protein TorRG33x02_271190 [Trema orientale]
MLLLKAILAASSDLEHPAELASPFVQFPFTCPAYPHVQQTIFFLLKFLLFLSTVNAEPSDDTLLLAQPSFFRKEFAHHF